MIISGVEFVQGLFTVFVYLGNYFCFSPGYLAYYHSSLMKFQDRIARATSLAFQFPIPHIALDALQKGSWYARYETNYQLTPPYLVAAPVTRHVVK